MRIVYKNLPIGSISALAKSLGVVDQLLISIAADPGTYYSVSQIPKKSGGLRSISDPAPTLKVIQRRIVRRIFSGFKFPNYLFGSVKDKDNPRDFVRNAEFHRHSSHVLAFDIESFFPSVQPQYVHSVYKYLMNFPDDVVDLLVRLTTLSGQLPQGAPTSSYLANLIFYDNEHKFVRDLASKKIKYSRLVDDITISSCTPFSPKTKQFVHTALRRMLSEKNLSVAEKKYRSTNTNVIGLKTVVTGLVIEGGVVKLPREKIEHTGGLVYTLVKRAAVNTTESIYHELYCKTSGLVALYSRLDASKALRYRNELRLIKPTYTPLKVSKISRLCRRFIKYGVDHKAQRSTEDFTRKYFRYKNKISIIARTHRKLAKTLHDELDACKPLQLLASFYE